MAYFSNGTEGDLYRAKYCDHCWHDRKEDCPVWGIHLAYNYGQKDDVEYILSWLIPKRALGAAECRMFLPLEAVGNPPSEVARE